MALCFYSCGVHCTRDSCRGCSVVINAYSAPAGAAAAAAAQAVALQPAGVANAKKEAPKPPTPKTPVVPPVATKTAAATVATTTPSRDTLALFEDMDQLSDILNSEGAALDAEAKRLNATQPTPTPNPAPSTPKTLGAGMTASNSAVPLTPKTPSMSPSINPPVISSFGYKCNKETSFVNHLL